jgi:hypothetical protein
MEQEKKGCSRCSKNEGGFEFTAKEKIYSGIAVVIVFFTFYGIIELVKDIISIF